MRTLEQNILLSNPRYIQQREYWLKKLATLAIEPGIFTPTTAGEGEFGEMELLIPEPVLYRLQQISKGSDFSLYLLLQSALKALMYHYTQASQVVLNSPCAAEYKTEKTFNTIVPLVDELAWTMSLKEVLLAVRQTTIDAYENQDYPLEQIFQSLKITDEEVGVLQSVFCAFYPLHEKLDLKLESGQLAFSFHRQGEGLVGKVTFARELASVLDFAQLGRHYVQVLQYFASDINLPVGQVKLLSAEERSAILSQSTGKTLPLPTATVCQLFELQAAKTPEAVAVVDAEKRLTYGQLNERANQVARLLQTEGVGPNQIVALMLGRKVEMIIGILATMKAGAAYLPIDPDYPEERVKFLLSDSGARLLIVESTYLPRTAWVEEKLCIDDESLFTGSGDNLGKANQLTDLAYVIYTSGTTGKPKGVLVEHQNVLNLTFGLIDLIYQEYTAPLNVAMVAPYVFDPSVQQIFPTLILGHTLFMVQKETILTQNSLLQFYREQAIDISDGTPTHLSILLNSDPEEREDLAVRHFLIGGEALYARVVQEFYAAFSGAEPKITNLYGPAECCVDTTTYLVDVDSMSKHKTIPIGAPMPNTQVYILDSQLELVPGGVTGEVYISGQGVSRGYLNRAELTAERFLPNPFDPAHRMYRTGDLARWLPTGEIEFIGRVDHQVKVNGYRIELGEITSVLLEYAPVEQAVVTVWEQTPGQKYLTAYVVSKEELTVAVLREYLSSRLPGYMVPSYFVQLERIPLTSHGKVNYQALPGPERGLSNGVEYVEARNEIEKNLCAIWQDVLKIEAISVHDNFFEIGGTSILLVQMQAQVDKVYQGKISVVDLFEYPTIAEIAALIEKGKNNAALDLTAAFLELPLEYLTQDSPATQSVVLNFSVEGELFSKLRAIAAGEEVELFDILLGLYTYLLSDVTGQEQITVQSIGEADKVLACAVELGPIEDFSDLFSRVKALRTGETTAFSYSFAEMQRLPLTRGARVIVPLFYDRTYFTAAYQTLKIYELALGFTYEAEKLHFICQYNPARLNKDKLKEFVGLYAQYIQELVNTFDQ